MERIDSYLQDAARVCILGHIRPDGDCVGSCLGLYHYLKTLAPALEVQVYLEPFSADFNFLKDADRISHDFEEEQVYDLCFVLDCSDRERLGGAVRYLESAGRSVCVDHHITNQGVCDVNIVEAGYSSASEVLVTRMDMDRIDLAAAECLYLGMVHDTGVFKHSNTSEQTMRLAGAMLAKGVSSSRIIDDTFYRKSFVQNKILGQALLNAELRLDGALIVCVLSREEMAHFGATKMDLDGIIDQMRVTEGVEAAAFLHEMEDGSYKISMRSNERVNVSVIAAEFGGGGHVRAAGAGWKGEPEVFLAILEQRIRRQLADTEV